MKLISHAFVYHSGLAGLELVLHCYMIMYNKIEKNFINQWNCMDFLNFGCRLSPYFGTIMKY